MATSVCSECGERNGVGVEFCAFCHAYLAWDDEELTKKAPARAVRPGRSDPQMPRSERVPRSAQIPSSEQTIETSVMPRVEVDPRARTQARRDSSDLGDSAEGRFRLTAEHDAVTVPVTGEPAGLSLQIANTSDIVDGYLVEAPGAPDWLVVEASQLQLLPGTDELLPVELRITSEVLIPAQQLRVVLGVRSMAQMSAHANLPVLVTVPVVDAPVLLRGEPRLVRVRDRDTSECVIVADNSRSNRPVRLTFSGSDPELAVRFRFEPETLEIGPGTSGSVKMSTTSPGPEPGLDISRALTVSAAEGDRRVETLVTLQQATSVDDPPVTLEVVPSLVRVRDQEMGMAKVVADNRRGTRWAHLHLRASDPERLVRATWAPSHLDVPPGKMAQAEVGFVGAPPERGTEVSRTITIRATDGERTSTQTATFVQVATASPMTTLGVDLEPSVVRVRDADSAGGRVILDNRKGHSGVRLSLSGSDPERAVQFTFMPPVVEVAAGRVLAVDLRLDALRPEPGAERTRSFEVTAGDGQASVEAVGSLVQMSSRAAIETLAIRLDPSVLSLANRRRGLLTAMLDNRAGNQPVQVTMSGDDPQNALGFTFSPATLTVPPGRAATTRVSIRAPRPESGREITLPFEVMASDGRSEVRTGGSVIQSAADIRPLLRAFFTLLGGLSVIGGALLPLRAANVTRSVDLNAKLLGEVFSFPTNLGGFERLATVGLVMMALGALVMFGLTGAEGRLSRLMALLGVLVVVSLLVALGFVGFSSTPGSGAILMIFGCVSGYVGGLLIRH